MRLLSVLTLLPAALAAQAPAPAPAAPAAPSLADQFKAQSPAIEPFGRRGDTQQPRLWLAGQQLRPAAGHRVLRFVQHDQVELRQRAEATGDGLD